MEISYLGSAFYGFQKQKSAYTVQGLLEDTLQKITEEKIKVVGAGRTDRGVHALAQVCNFQTACGLPPEKIKDALNALLPLEVRVNHAREVPQNFHARRCVKGKLYAYLVWTEEVMSPFLLNFSYHYPYPMEAGRMRSALDKVVGEHDFCSFAKAGVYKGGTIRVIQGVRLIEDEHLLCFLIQGAGFLQHMVRTIVGTVLEVGRGQFEPEQILEILAKRNRSAAGPTAPACGLYLIRVIY